MPEPYVIFNDFGSSSLDFDLYFWVDMRKASRFVAQSDLRYKIIELFEERNITIAFPQLDIHFDKDVSHNMAIVNHPQGKEASRE
jgi:small-conductance mechanosensitive channel